MIKFFSHYYKVFYRKILILLFYTVRGIILFINAKDIVEILNSTPWKNIRSILYFYTSLIIDDKNLNQKNYPVKRFKLRWYIWLVYYIYAAQIITKILIYLFIFYSIRFVKRDFWIILWLVLLEYWRLRLGVFFWLLYIFYLITLFYTTAFRIGYYLNDNKFWFHIAFLKFIKLYFYWKIFILNLLKYFIVRDKFKWNCLGY